MSEFSINLPNRMPATGAAPNVLTAVIPDPPRTLAQIDNGTIIKGLVHGRDPDGLLIVVTDKGALKLSTPANIPTGSQVTLEIRAAGDRMQVLVLSIEGHATGGTASQGPRAGAAPPPSTSGGGPSPAPSPSTAPAPVAIEGSVLHGTIVQASPETLSQLMRTLVPGPPGASTILTAAELAALSIPADLLPEASAADAAALPKALASALQADVRAKIEALFFAASPAKGASQSTGTFISGPPGQVLEQGLKLPIPLTTGSEVRLRLVAIASGPGLPLAIPASASGVPHVMAGRIIGYTPSGNAVLNSPLGAIILQGHFSLPVGTELAVAVEPMLPMPTALPGAGPLSLPQLLLSIARGWPSLADAIGLLRQNGGDADTLAALSHLPQAGPKLAAGLVAAMQAIRANDAEALLGALIAGRSGSAGRDESARRVRQELAQVATLAQDRPGIDWRCCFIPILDDGTIRQINLFYRRDRHKDRKDGKDDRSGTRFIVEVDMSKMGPFQFDGLVREKQFDLMVRSHVALPAKFRKDITELFHEALTLGDYRGGLMFQKVRDFPVSPLEEIEKSATRISA